MNFVTGATGIMGSHVALALARRGLPVIAGKRKGSDTEKTRRLFSYYKADALFDNIKWVDIDLLDIFSLEEALQGVETVYHCAGLVSFSKKHRKQLKDVNEKGTRHIVNTCLHLNIPALCHVSSVATLNNHDPGKTITENVFWKRSGKESDYAISKYNAEREVWRGIHEGLNAVIVNPAVILAAGFWEQSSSRIFTTCYKGNLFYTKGTTGYVSAVDVAEIMIRLVEQKKFGERFVLAENNYSYQEIFSRLSRNFNRRAPFIHAGPFILHSGHLVESILALFRRTPTLTRALIHSALNRQRFDASKVKQTLGYTFQSVPLVLDEICEAYLKANTNH
jgi:dihydroflavonol-4-reductase